MKWKKSMFDIRKSAKSHLESPEHFIVVKDDYVVLRIHGEEPNYVVMTATAGEDTGNIHSVRNQKALIEAAHRVSSFIKVPPCIKFDYQNREFVEICSCEYLSDAYKIAEMLFKYLNDYSENRSSTDMQPIYHELAIDNSGSDVYLSDGEWLRSDGSFDQN